MNTTIKFLSEYPDANVQACASMIQAHLDRKTKILNLIKEALDQIRLDVKYLSFDCACSKRERDEALGKL